MVNYQIFSGKFFKNFNDLNSKVPYLCELGINNIWLTPFLQSNSYHGYDILDYYTIKEEYGTLEDFKNTVDLLKSKNIGLIMDFVICHTSNEHIWFQKAIKGEYPYKDFYVWRNLEQKSSKDEHTKDQSNEHKWAYNEDLNMYYFCPFGGNMPSLNLDNPQLRAEIENIVYFWLKLGVVGFRLDAVLHSHLTKEDSINFWHWFRKTVRKYKDDAILVGEAWTTAENMADWSNALGSCMNFETQGYILHLVNTNDLRNLPHKIKEINDKVKWANHIDSIFLSNHDTDRVMTCLNNDINKMKIASTVLLTSKGIPYIYYGDEIGTLGNRYETGDKRDENVRKPMEWNKVTRQRFEKDSLFKHYKKLISLRNSSNALKYGNLVPLWSSSSQCAVYMRSFYNENIYIIINNKDGSFAHIPNEMYKVLYTTDTDMKEIIEYYGNGLKKGIYILKMI